MICIGNYPDMREIITPVNTWDLVDIWAFIVVDFFLLLILRFIFDWFLGV